MNSDMRLQDLDNIFKQFGGRSQDSLLPLLHDIQDKVGYIDSAHIPRIAKLLNIAPAEVHGVITYYHHFRVSPPARHVIRICRAESCQAAGGEALLKQAKKSAQCDLHESSADGAITLEPVYCLGLCAASPALQVDEDTLHADMTPQKLEDLITRLKKDA